MSHQALARKYRPRGFGEVSTQEHVSETLRRAVAGGRVGHAYLFCGPRGVGKTTLARVLAMALNCPERGDDGEPCGRCESCERIWGGHTALDVIEIDAASNRGVDAARELRERAQYAPSAEGRYKVYIVDEAHMLTREAWNALLKILEEPPPRVLFVFATTEPQKIQQSASPILSRCQRFDFRRIAVADISERLASVLRSEGESAPDEALRLLARKADGGLRDGLSLLDQVLALSGGKITVEAVRRVLGLVEEERYLELFDLLSERRHGDVFGFVEALLDEGYDLNEFYLGLVDALRLLLRIALAGPESAPDVPEHLRVAFAERAERFVPGDLVRMLAMASELESTGSLRRSGHPRLLIEMLLLRLSYLERTVELEELLRGLGGAPALADPPEVPVAAGAGSAHGPPGAGRPASTGGAEAQAGERSLAEAWHEVIERGEGLPAGMQTFLRSVEPEEPAPGTVLLRVPEPAADRLEAGGSALEDLTRALARALGRKVRVGVERAGVDPAVASHSAGRRISQDEVREGRLRKLVEKEPLLGRAVEELDLELLD